MYDFVSTAVDNAAQNKLFFLAWWTTATDDERRAPILFPWLT
jgi:hypothetical protein